MANILLAVLAVLAVLAIGVLVYFKCFVTPLDKEGMVYQGPARQTEEGDGPSRGEG